MLTSTHPWYTDGTVWSAVGAVAGVLAVIIAVAAVGLQLLDPNRRRLAYRLDSATALVAGPAPARSKLKITYDDKPVQHPYVAEIRLTGQGRKDVSSADFDQRRPLLLDMGGARILEILDVTSVGGMPPPARFRGSTLEIGPALIKKRQCVTWILLCDGKAPVLTCPNGLADVEIGEQKGDNSPPLAPRAWVVVSVAAALAALAMVAYLSSPSAPWEPGTSSALKLAATALNAAFCAGVAAAAALSAMYHPFIYRRFAKPESPAPTPRPNDMRPHS